MFETLPSLLAFQPKFYSGGPVRFHLPLLYDLIATLKPGRVVTLGFGDGQAFFTFCQAVTELGLDGECVAVRRERDGEAETDDTAWEKGKDDGQEVYGECARYFGSASAALAELAEGSVNLLLLDDCDSGAEIRADLAAWASKLAPEAIVLLHGAGLERVDSPKTAWTEWTAQRVSTEFPAGLGLGLARQSPPDSSAPFLLKQLFGSSEEARDLGAIYALAAARIDALGRAEQAEKTTATLQVRQIWLDSLLADRGKVQTIMDHQGRSIAALEQAQAELQDHFENLRRDRAKAQLVMDGQQEQLRNWVAEAEKLKSQIEKLKTQVKDQKQILNAAKIACRRGGKCFQVQGGPKVRKSFGERVVRELKRLPRSFRISRPPKAVPDSKEAAAPAASRQPVDRYAAWISEHEPDETALERQRQSSGEFSTRLKISLLTPVHNTPANYLEEMFQSVAAQTYGNWEICVIDGGSDRPETIETLRRWEASEARIRIERLTENLGIAENTNRALQMASGDLVACVDHDDLLAPFALFELARAALEFEQADIFYSDEDRLSAKGKRHAPFFKPEWSPELLLASMYIGHLTAYRRSLALELGGFRKEFDMSQDYDFALRATERAKSIRHIPHVLYHWREHAASGSTGGKPGARQTNLAALGEAMRRRNLPAEIIEYPTANRARLKVANWPRVSIIVPTDSPMRAQACLRDLPQATKYPDLEIILVTNSKLAEPLRFLEGENVIFRFVPYDTPFNFSDKCNLGAEAATGTRLIFFNDDVESIQPDWIQNLIEPLENPEVGAVAPKLVYETGQIQHAGLVTGVRGLIGTAFHQRAADSTEHVNFAQSLRDVSALSAACLAMRRSDFFQVGGFDAANTPIAHSDVDLCFKVREAGLRCVYTPYATLRHLGHVSIGATETKSRPRKADKATTFLLKRWGSYVTHDPYFTDNMRDWLHLDSPTPIRMHAVQPAAPIDASPDLLFVSHDLTLSGAPLLLLHLARWCSRNGMFVTVMAPTDGPLREKYENAGIPLIIDPLCETGHESFGKFARDFDCVLTNTVRTEGAVRAAHKANVPVIWWVHETRVGEHYLREEAKLRSALPMADAILAPTERTASVYRPCTESPVVCSPYGIPDVRGESDGGWNESPPDILRFLLLGSIEPRKGQDIFLEAISLLPEWVQKVTEFRLIGRVMDSEFGSRIEKSAARLPNVVIEAESDHAAALEAIQRCHVLVCSSRDEALPVTILEALSFGKAVISARVGGIGEVLTEAKDAILVKPEDPKALANAIQRIVGKPELARQLGEAGRATFEEKLSEERFGADFRELVAEVIRTKT
ncbi:MAG TPA: glycosyltransferase [Chthoniobacterales bacterium]|nr:glycosyltransferase [Chthoniobacterales bacterium]